MPKDKTKHHKKDKPKKDKPKKDKPKKERKTKGIKQSQKQKQIVNIKIGGGGGDDEKKMKLPLPIPMPNIIFNPSLSMQPNAYPIVKPETYPPFFETPMIPNFNIPEQTPQVMINNNIEKPKANIPIPIAINKNDNPIKQPPEVYQPIPQDDVSKPKEQIPELYIGEEKI